MVFRLAYLDPDAELLVQLMAARLTVNQLAVTRLEVLQADGPARGGSALDVAR
jgi:hypothetical protein